MQNKKDMNYMELNTLLIDVFAKAEKQAIGHKRRDRFYIKALVKNKELVNAIYRDIYVKVAPEALENMVERTREFIKKVENNEDLPSIKNKLAYCIAHYRQRYSEGLQVEGEKKKAYLMGAVVLSILSLKHFMDKGEL